MDDETTGLSPDDLRRTVQDAVDAAAAAYTADAGVDVEQQVRAELRSRGLELDDDAWVRDLAHHVRSGHPVEIGADPQ